MIKSAQISLVLQSVSADDKNVVLATNELFSNENKFSFHVTVREQNEQNMERKAK